MEINYYLNNIDYGEIVLILGSRYNRKTQINGKTVMDFLLKISTDSKVSKVSKMLNIEKSTLYQTPDNITNLEETIIILAYQLLQGKELVVNYLDVSLNYKEERYLKRLLKKLSHNYNVKIAIFTNNIKFCFGLIDKIFIVNEKEIVRFLSNDFYNLEIYNYIDMPEIIEFIMTNINNGKQLDRYLEISDLIKGIYRIC